MYYALLIKVDMWSRVPSLTDLLTGGSLALKGASHLFSIEHPEYV